MQPYRLAGDPAFRDVGLQTLRRTGASAGGLHRYPGPGQAGKTQSAGVTAIRCARCSCIRCSGTPVRRPSGMCHGSPPVLRPQGEPSGNREFRPAPGRDARPTRRSGFRDRRACSPDIAGLPGRIESPAARSSGVPALLVVRCSEPKELTSRCRLHRSWQSAHVSPVSRPSGTRRCSLPVHRWLPAGEHSLSGSYQGHPAGGSRNAGIPEGWRSGDRRLCVLLG